MKTIRVSCSAFCHSRVLLSVAFCLTSIILAVAAFAPALAQPGAKPGAVGAPDLPEVIGPVSLDTDLRKLPYIAPNEESEDGPLRRHAKITGTDAQDSIVIAAQRVGQVVTMPSPALVFNGISAAESGCGCLPPDTQGDVGLNHYILSVNSSFKIFSKTGAVLAPATTFNSFFAGLATSGTPCGLNQNQGDPFVFYDHMADRWVITDFAFPAFPGVSFYQCIGVSKTSDPVSGGWWLYALQVDPGNPTFLGDYPKLSVWPDAWYLTLNLFSNGTTFNGVRAIALNRAQMINGTGAPTPNAIGYTLDPATLGDTYSLVPASFRAGNLPPAGRAEYLLAIDSPSAAGVSLTKVHVWRFKPDFATPANSTFGVGANHAFNADVTVAPFVDAFTTVSDLVPQPATTAKLDTLGDKIMTPVVYTNIGGNESLWASHTVNNNQGGTGPTGVRWYQFNVTGGGIPATPAQQQTYTNAGDGIWRFMPSIAVDAAGNMAIGYAASSATVEPSIRWAGRLAGDAANTLAQGEAVMQAGGGHQTSTSGRWGDYSYMNIDPRDNLSFWHTNEFYSATTSSNWNTAVGKFRFSSAPVALSAVSRKTHGGGGTFDIPLPATGSVGVESRTGSPNAGQHLLVITLNAPSTVATATASPAPVSVNSFTVSGSEVMVNLSGVSDASRVTVTLGNVNDGVSSGNVNVPVGFLLGDANGDGAVNSGDATITRAASGSSATSSNFRADYNLDGTINGGDITITRARSGNFVP